MTKSPKTRLGWILLALSAGILFFAIAAGLLIPFSASPKPSTVVGVGVVAGLLVATFGVGLIFPHLSVSTRLVTKRLAIAFGLVMVINALFAFGPGSLLDAIPAQSSMLFYLGCVWLAPAMIYLFVLHSAPMLSTHRTGVLRAVRMAVLTGFALGLSFASSLAFVGFWLARLGGFER
jgi:hypothetical protein